jgi:ABC-type transport system involved in cytochrome c biogenesis permease subunit
MKKIVPFLVLIAAVTLVGLSLLPRKNHSAFDLAGYGRLPVLANGRFKPLDTVARSSLLQLQSRQAVRNVNVREPMVGSPIEWLLDVFYRPEKADSYQTFAIEHLEQPEVMAMIGRNPETLRIKYNSAILNILAITDAVPKTQRRFSFNELQPHLGTIEAQAKLAREVESGLRTPFQRAVVQLYANLGLYVQLRHAMVAPDRPDFVRDLLQFQEKLPAGAAAFRAQQAGQPYDEAAFNLVADLGDRFGAMDRFGLLLIAPPDSMERDITHWKTAGDSLLETTREAFSGQEARVNSTVLAYAGFGQAWRTQNADSFNKLLSLLQDSLAKRFEPELKKSAKETRFNAAAPFYTSTLLYAFAFFLAIFSWLIWPEALGRSAFYLIGLAWLLTTVGIVTRMTLEWRPPVTNLYSSALFIGWGATGLCLILEYIFKNAIGSVAAGAIGFVTLIIAHHLSLSGDTLEMMRAVLDTNIWLATHVVIVTTGYAATFLAGLLGMVGVFLYVAQVTMGERTLQPWRAIGLSFVLSPLVVVPFGISQAKRTEFLGQLTRMVYGIVCFATLCSFAGTVLGGIWADQSWGRFWGWDPKENGALIIVLWNAIILHARWGGMIKQRGLMNMAVFGNIVTSWSWFGTNMLGVGLHNYGFTEAAFVALVIFVSTQLAVIALGTIPLGNWGARSPMPANRQPEPALADK